MNKLLTLVVVLGGATFCQAQNYSTVLTGDQEVPPNSSTSTFGSYAFANFTLSGGTLAVTSAFYGNLNGDPTLITVNDAPLGFNASSPLFDLTINNDETTVSGGLVDGSFSGSGALTQSEINDLNAGDLYVNIETAAAPGGEVRGQITTVVPEPASMTLMAVGSLSWLAMRRKKS
ncbi:MAG TPA: CHRD domain-containing protein [Verrucomicrobiae bacterium]|jgi:hypothetical protein